MKRWARNSFCLFSLLVFVSSVTLWVRSYFVAEGVVWRQRSTPTGLLWYEVSSSRGAVGVSRYRVEGIGFVGPGPGWDYERSAKVESLYIPKQAGERAIV